jgi:hypothetical protein
LTVAGHTESVPRIELIPMRTPDGSVVLRVAGLPRGERLRRFWRRLTGRAGG